MFADDELALLIKSKYPVVFVESVDEQHVIVHLIQIAQQLNLNYYEWSVTNGLRRKYLKDAYYETQEPVKALKTILDLKDPSAQNGDALFVLKDFEKNLEDAVVLRLFKDVINVISNTATTIVILSSRYKLPPEIESCAAHIIAGYPTEEEIISEANATIGAYCKNHKATEVRLTPEEEERMIAALKGLTTQQVKNVVNQCLVEDGIVDGKMVPRVEKLKKDIFDREGLLEFCTPESNARIANFSNLKRWLAERKGTFSAKSKLPAPKGVLLMGVQGCGKSLAVKVIAGELGLPLYRLDLIRFYSKYIGETEQNLRKALKTIDQLSPICLWIDEIEKNFASSSDGDIDGGVSMRLMGTFLTWMQERTSSCFVAATANNIYSLPPEFLRKGRFDEMFFVGLPDQKTREELFSIHISKRGLDSTNFDCASLAGLAADFNGAEIEQAVVSALYCSTSRREKIKTDHIAAEIKATKPLAVVKSEDIAALREWAAGRTVPA